MNRRLAVLAAALGGLLVLPSCSTFDRGVAARVDGTEISDDVVQFDLIRNQPDPQPGAPKPSTAVTGEDARTTLTLLVQTVSNQHVAQRYGIDLTADRATVRQRMEAAMSTHAKRAWDRLSATEQDLELDANGALSSAMANATVDPPTNLEALYANPEETGFVCLRGLAFDTEADAEAAAAQLDAGVSFADVANQQHPDSNGGILTDAGNECVSVGAFNASAGPLLKAIYDAAPGQRTQIAVTPAGASGGPRWYIFLNRPYDEIKDQLTAAAGLAPQFSAEYGQLFRADVSISSRYGRWDRYTQSVVALT